MTNFSGEDAIFLLKTRLISDLIPSAPHAGFNRPKNSNSLLPMHQFQYVEPMHLLMHQVLDLRFAVTWLYPIESEIGKQRYFWVDLADLLQRVGQLP